MNTELRKIEGSDGKLTENDLKLLRRAGEILRSGGLVAFPTETVYGLGGDALRPESARKIYEAKGRPSDNPLIVHICRQEDLPRIAAAIPEEARTLAERFWPGPLTMILPKSAEVPRETTGGLETVAVRMPSDPVARKLIEYAGGYVAAPSANRSGRPSPTSADRCAEDLDGLVEMILDGGENVIGIESTIVDLTVSPPQILRPGAVTAEMIGEALGTERRIETDPALLCFGGRDAPAPKAPGMKYRHYAPNGELMIVEGEPERVAAYIDERVGADHAIGERVGVLASRETFEKYNADVVLDAGSREDAAEAAHSLYSCLRRFDDEGITRIYAESFPTDGIGEALRNRMLKAAGYRVIQVI